LHLKPGCTCILVLGLTSDPSGVRTSKQIGSKHLIAVVAGTTLGMMIVNIPTVLFAERATKWVPVKMVRFVAAAISAVLRVATLLGHSGIGLG
jgi:putative Ca2+/H+ antiporter (TMEM165/GDT1 family)